MSLIFVMVSMSLARSFGFRHRPLPDDDSVFRTTDVHVGLMLFASIGIAVGSAASLFVPDGPAWVSTIFGVIGMAILLAGGTLWMPFLEHVGMLTPGDVPPQVRSRIVIFARTIPYLYAATVGAIALLFAFMIVVFLGIVVMGIAQIAGFDRAGEGTTPPLLWIGGGVGLVAWGYMARHLIMSGRQMQDWGLPTWAEWIEPGQQCPAGEWLFGPLDATVGRFTRAVTTPATPDHANTLSAPTHISDVQRMPGDVFDVSVGILGGVVVVSVLIALGTPLLLAIAPDLATILSTPTSDSGQIQPAQVAVWGGVLAPMLLTMLGVVNGLRMLADRSHDDLWAQQRPIRWLARGLEVLRLLICAGASVLVGLAVALVGIGLLTFPTWGALTIGVITALVTAPTLLRMPASADSYMLTFLANVDRATWQERT